MALSDYEFKTELIGRPFREGQAKGQAKAILTVLAARKIGISDEERERITGSTDLEELDL